MADAGKSGGVWPPRYFIFRRDDPDVAALLPGSTPGIRIGGYKQ